jgi:excinuclease ABC subunit C
MKNAKISHLARLQESREIEKTLRTLRDQLGLKTIPRVIEGFDISHIRGGLAVGSVVVWENNTMLPSRYRRFKIKNVAGLDEYAMMMQVVRRRLERKISESEILPDLMLIDGGLGHANIAQQVLQELNIKDVPVIGIAKGRTLDQSLKDRLYKPGKGKPIILSPDSQALHILQRIRDEAHRFAITFHQKMRRKRGLHSILDEIPGVGKTRKKSLLRHFGSLKNLKIASPEMLRQVDGIDAKTADNIFRFFSEP